MKAHEGQCKPMRTHGSQHRPEKANEDPQKLYRDQVFFFFVCFLSSFFQLIINIFVYFPANEDPTKANMDPWQPVQVNEDPWQPEQANTGSRNPMQAIEYLNGVFFSFSTTPTSPWSFQILFSILHERHHRCSHPFTLYFLFCSYNCR